MTPGLGTPAAFKQNTCSAVRSAETEADAEASPPATHTATEDKGDPAPPPEPHEAADGPAHGPTRGAARPRCAAAARADSDPDPCSCADADAGAYARDVGAACTVSAAAVTAAARAAAVTAAGAFAATIIAFASLSGATTVSKIGPASSKPNAAQPVPDEPIPAQPTTTDPAASEPCASEPFAAQCVTAEPTTAQPTTTLAVPAQPTTTLAVPAQSRATQPSPTEPVSTFALAARSTASKSAAAKPAATQPAAFLTAAASPTLECVAAVPACKQSGPRASAIASLLRKPTISSALLRHNLLICFARVRVRVRVKHRIGSHESRHDQHRPCMCSRWYACVINFRLTTEVLTPLLRRAVCPTPAMGSPCSPSCGCGMTGLFCAHGSCGASTGGAENHPTAAHDDERCNAGTSAECCSPLVQDVPAPLGASRRDLAKRATKPATLRASEKLCAILTGVAPYAVRAPPKTLPHACKSPSIRAARNADGGICDPGEASTAYRSSAAPQSVTICGFHVLP